MSAPNIAKTSPSHPLAVNAKTKMMIVKMLVEIGGINIIFEDL